MIDHTGIHVTHIALSKPFYVAVLSTLGYVVRLDLETAVGFGAKDLAPGDDPAGAFWIAEAEPFRPEAISRFAPPARPRWWRFMRPRWQRARATTALRVCARSTTRTTTRRS